MGATLLQDLGLESSELSANGDKACCVCYVYRHSLRCSSRLQLFSSVYTNRKNWSQEQIIPLSKIFPILRDTLGVFLKTYRQIQLILRTSDIGTNCSG